MLQTYPVLVETGSVSRRVATTAVNQDQISFVLTNDLIELLRHNEAFTVRLKDQTFAVSLKGSAEILQKLNACWTANASRATRR
jgi:hypothetical protein